MAYPVSIIPFTSLIPLSSLFSGITTNLLNVVGTTSTGSLVDENSRLTVGETVSIGGTNYEVLGSGWAQPGISILGIPVATGTRQDAIFLENLSTGKTTMVFPAGVPNATGMIALMTYAEPVGYDMASFNSLCFLEGTRLETPDGPVAVEHLREGMALRRRSGEQTEIVWIGGHRSARSRVPDERLMPVEIGAGALGRDRPGAPVRVSPQHRILLEDGRIVGAEGPVLVAAKGLLGLAGIRQLVEEAPLYYHLLCSAGHCLLTSEGLGVESLLLGDMSQDWLGASLTARLAERMRALGKEPETKPCLPVVRPGQAARAIRKRTQSGLQPR